MSQLQNNSPQIRVSAITWLVIAFLCIIWPLSIVIFVSPESISQQGDSANLILSYYLPTIIVQIIILFIVFITVKFENSSLISIGLSGTASNIIKQTIFLTIIALIVLRGMDYLLGYINISDPNDYSILLPVSIKENTVWIFMTAIVAVTEESAYRGYLLSRLTKIFKSKLVAILIASLAFMLGHFYLGINGMISVFLYSLIVSVFFIKTKSLLPCIIVHFINNMIIILIKNPA